jgi:hypothetical protein
VFFILRHPNLIHNNSNNNNKVHPAPSRAAVLGSRAQGRVRPRSGEDIGFGARLLPLVSLSQAHVLERGVSEAWAWEAQSHPVRKCLD